MPYKPQASRETEEVGGKLKKRTEGKKKCAISQLVRKGNEFALIAKVAAS